MPLQLRRSARWKRFTDWLLRLAERLHGQGDDTIDSSGRGHSPKLSATVPRHHSNSKATHQGPPKAREEVRRRGKTFDRRNISRPLECPPTDPSLPGYHGKSLPLSPRTVTFATRSMGPSTVTEVLTQIGERFGHIAYAVSGLAALVAYGYRGRQPSYVMMVCPSYAKEVIRCWAAASGMYIEPLQPDAFGIALLDGTTRKVKIKYIDDDAFEVMDVAMRLPTGTSLLSMPALLDALAKKYMQKGISGHSARLLGGDMLWLLGRMAEKQRRHPGQGIESFKVPHIVDGEFWHRFTLVHPEAAALFRNVGIRPPARLYDDASHAPDRECDSGLSALETVEAPSMSHAADVRAYWPPPKPRRRPARFFVVSDPESHHGPCRPFVETPLPNEGFVELCLLEKRFVIDQPSADGTSSANSSRGRHRRNGIDTGHRNAPGGVGEVVYFRPTQDSQ